MPFKEKFWSKVIIFMNIKKSMSGSEWNSEDYSLQQNEGSPRRSKRAYYTTDMLEVLNKWIEDHIEYPYPNSDEFKALSDQTGLDEKQVRIWFTNTRKRRLRITREEFKFKQNTFIRNLIESQQQDSLNSAPVPTFDQAVQTDPVIKQEYERGTHRKSMRESSNYSQFWPADYFIKNILFTAEVVDLNEM